MNFAHIDITFGAVVQNHLTNSPSTNRAYIMNGIAKFHKKYFFPQCKLILV